MEFSMKLRRRVIHDTWWDSKTRRALSFPAREIFMGLWCISDREGRFEYDVDILMTKLYARQMNERDLFIESLNEIEKMGCFVRYSCEKEGEKEEYAVIPTFQKYQKIPPKEAQSTLPTPPLHINCTATDMQLHGNCTATAPQLHSNYKTSSPLTLTSNSTSTSTSTSKGETEKFSVKQQKVANDICLWIRDYLQRISGDIPILTLTSSSFVPIYEMLADGHTADSIQNVYRLVFENEKPDDAVNFHRRHLSSRNFSTYLQNRIGDILITTQAVKTKVNKGLAEYQKSLELIEKAKNDSRDGKTTPLPTRQIPQKRTETV